MMEIVRFKRFNHVRLRQLVGFLFLPSLPSLPNLLSFISLTSLMMACASSPASQVANGAAAGVANTTDSRVTASAPLDVQAELSATQAADGAVVLVNVRIPKRLNPRNEEITGEFGDTKFYFYPAPGVGEDAWQALVGIPHNHKPGLVDVVVRIGETPIKLPLSIVDAHYHSEVLKVGGRHINPRKSDLKQIQLDIQEAGKIYSTVTREKYWKGPFVYPIESVVTSVYGTKRLFNGQMQSYHNGLDLRAAVGTEIHAAAPGVVVLAREMFFTGNTVLIDHGYGLVTLYAHMSKLGVKKGDHVEARQLLGLSGMTGRVSGPHLHWAVIINKVKVNPLEALKVIR